MTRLADLLHPPRTIEPGATARDAARRMETFSVGSLVVVDDERPVGMLTDRDLALKILEEERDPGEVSVRELMSEDLVTLAPDASLRKAIEVMKEEGVRRLPVVDADGKLKGVVAADDVLEILARELGQLAAVVRAMPPVGVAQGVVDGDTGPGSKIYGKE